MGAAFISLPARFCHEPLYSTVSFLKNKKNIKKKTIKKKKEKTTPLMLLLCFLHQFERGRGRGNGGAGGVHGCSPNDACSGPSRGGGGTRPRVAMNGGWRTWNAIFLPLDGSGVTATGGHPGLEEERRELRGRHRAGRGCGAGRGGRRSDPRWDRGRAGRPRQRAEPEGAVAKRVCRGPMV